MNNINLLLTCIGGYFGLCNIRALRESDKPKIRIVGVDADPNATARFFVDSFYTVPMGNDGAYIHEILKICKKEKIDIILPGADEEVYAISQKKTEFSEKGIICAVDEFNNLKLIRDRWRLYKTLEKNNLAVPDFKLISNNGELKMAADFFNYPTKKFVIIPRISKRASRGVWIVGNDENSVNLDKVTEYIKEDGKNELSLLASEYLPGEAYDIDVIAKAGTPLCILPRRRVYRNRLSGVSEGHYIENNKKIIDYSSDIIRTLKLDGPFDFDFGSFEDSEPAVYEINPRMSGSVAAGLGAGLNLPLLVILSLIKKDLSIPKPNYGIYMFPVHDMIFLEKKRLYDVNGG